MFSAKMNDSKILKGMIDAVSAIIDETYLVADANGLNLTAFDESHICLMHAELPKEIFNGGYGCTDPHKIGVNLEDMSKIMKRASATDGIEFKHEPGGEKFHVVMRGRGTRDFSVRVIDIDSEKVPPTSELDVDFTSHAKFDVSVLEDAIKDAEIYQDTLEIVLKKEGLKMSAQGEAGEIMYDLPADQLDESNIMLEKVDENGKTISLPVARGVFSLSFLKNILKVSAIADKVSISVAADAPIKIEYEVAVGGIEQKGHVTYFLAPRVTEDDASGNE